jgi:hypothetical protein
MKTYCLRSPLVGEHASPSEAEGGTLVPAAITPVLELDGLTPLPRCPLLYERGIAALPRKGGGDENQVFVSI